MGLAKGLPCSVQHANFQNWKGIWPISETWKQKLAPDLGLLLPVMF